MNQIRITMSNLYLYIAAVIFGVPILCGGVIVGVTYRDARQDVKIWRNEFQLALDQQCPAEEVNILGGAGQVYLQAYLLDYQWQGERLSCSSNGRIIQCSCRSETGEYTSVSKYADQDLVED